MPKKTRLKIEREFHDRKADGLVKNQGFYQLDITRDIREKVFCQIGNLCDKRILDYGCGSGWMAIEFAKKGGGVVAVDLSGNLLRKAREDAVRNRVYDRMIFCQMDGEELGLKNCELDLAYGNAILHHIDLKEALNQIYYILKKGGIAYFIEPLGYNPLINIYRKFTPDKRTIDEKPFTVKEINVIKKKFANYRFEYYFFLALLSFFWVYIFKNDTIFLKTLELLKQVDKALLKAFPFLQKYCWLVLIRLKK